MRIAVCRAKGITKWPIVISMNRVKVRKLDSAPIRVIAMAANAQSTYPPSIVRLAPVMYADSLLARGWPTRPRGTRDFTTSR